MDFNKKSTPDFHKKRFSRKHQIGSKILNQSQHFNDPRCDWHFICVTPPFENQCRSHDVFFGDSDSINLIAYLPMKITKM